MSLCITHSSYKIYVWCTIRQFQDPTLHSSNTIRATPPFCHPTFITSHFLSYPHTKLGIGPLQQIGVRACARGVMTGTGSGTGWRVSGSADPWECGGGKGVGRKLIRSDIKDEGRRNGRGLLARGRPLPPSLPPYTSPTCSRAPTLRIDPLGMRTVSAFYLTLVSTIS